jgi:hemolysin III
VNSESNTDDKKLPLGAGKPRLRGISHKYGFYVSLVMGAALSATATSPELFWVSLIYALSLSSLLGVSALYHCVNWPPAKRQWMRRLDHTMIFVLIAGSYTPVCSLVLTGTLARATLSIVWGSVVLGALFNLVWLKAPKWIMAVLCVGVGWVAVATVEELNQALGPVFLALLGMGGLLYTVGALIYALKRPNPNPAVFGYHEIFHALVLAAAACHFAAFEFFIFMPLRVP